MPRRSPAQKFVYGAASRIDTVLRHRAELGTRRLARRMVHDTVESARRQIARLRRAAQRDSGQPNDSLAALRRVVAANLAAAKAYRPQPYDGTVVLFWGTEGSLEAEDTRLCWDQVATGGLEVHIVPGDHNSLREEPHVRVLAAKLRRCLDRSAVAARSASPYHGQVKAS
jgi:thioesterase domain-containing protein